MRKFTPHTAHRTPHLTARLKKIMFVCSFLWMLFSNSLLAQTGISLTWDQAVGCQITSPNGDDPKRYDELIQTATCLRVCEHSIVHYTLVGNDNSGWVSTNWNIIGGVIQSQNTSTCTVAWGSAGVGSISASINIGVNIETIPSLCVEIINSPAASFSVNQVSGTKLDVCRNQIIYFTNTSTPNGGSELISYQWDFGDGSFSSEFQPTHFFINSGSYTVKLTVKNACKCSNTWETDFNVGGEGVPIDCLSVVCENDRATYNVPSQIRCQDYPTNTGAGDTDPTPTDPIPGSGTIGTPIGKGNTTQEVVNRHWSVIGGVITSTLPYYNQIEVLWNHIDESGFGYVSFESTGCDVECQSKTTIKVPVVQQFGTIVGELNPCPNKQYRYKLPQWPTTDFNWSIETDTGATLIPTDQRNEVIIQTMGAGVISLSAIYHNTLLNCGGVTRDFAILVKDAPVIDGPTKVCLGATVYTLPEGFTGAWEIKNTKGILFQSGNGNSFTANFNNPGNYILTVTGEAFCAIPSIKIRVLPKPAIPIATNVIGPRIVCPGTPVTYRYTNENPNSVIGWGANGGVFAGSNYGETVTAQFLTSYPSNLDYGLKVWRENKEVPHCVSDTLQIIIKKPDLNLAIAAEDTVKGKKPCPSSYQSYSIKKPLGTQPYASIPPYTEGEVYEWSLINPATGFADPTLGSVSSGDGTSSITILWNEFTVNTNTRIQLKLRKCNGENIFYFDVTILATYPISIVAPDIVCDGQSFSYEIVPASSNIVWLLDEHPFNGSITMANPNDTSHLLKAIVSGVGGCSLINEVTKVITTVPNPQGEIYPKEDTFLCQIAPVTFTISNLEPNNGVTINWYKETESNSIGSGNSITVNEFGYYYAIITNSYGCSLTTSSTGVLQEICGGTTTPGGSCTLSPEPNFSITRTLPGNCGQIQSNISFNNGIIPVSYHWTTNAPSTECTLLNGNDATQSIFEYSKPGVYTITYTAGFHSVEGGTCTRFKSMSTIVPYLAKMITAVSCGTGNYYNINIKNESISYSSTPYTSEEYFLNGVSQGLFLPVNGQITLSVLPGNYTLKLVIYRDGYAPCSVESVISLPSNNRPNASFSYTSLACSTNCSEICTVKPLLFTIQSPLPNETYLWDFGDGAKNTLQNPEKVFTLADGAPNANFNIILKATNAIGCVSTYSKMIYVRQNKLIGVTKADPENGIACEGKYLKLYNYDEGDSPPTQYTWMENFSALPVTTANFYPNTSGSYWIMLRDYFGCTSPTPFKSATFVMVPDTTISGPSAVCTDTPFTLSGFAGGANTQYQWKMGGVIESNFALNNSELFQDIQGGLGDYDYILNIKVPKTGSSTEFCYSPDITKLVTIYSPPNPPTVNIVTNVETNSCTPYALTLHATSDQIGTFNWSNGASTENSNESTIVVNEGGPFEVKFTNLAGCDASSQIVVPKDPDTYMWVFPNGCYEFCNKPLNTSHFLLGPLPEFATWEWQLNETSESGTGVTPNYNMNTDTSTHHLVLGNPFCTRTSKPMDVILNICEACEFRASIKEIFAVQREFCSYDIVCTISNPYTYPIAVSISPQENIGYFQPLTITVLPGTDHYTLNMVPLNNFNGGIQNIIFQSVTADGIMCASEVEGQFPRLCIVRRVANEVGNANGISMVVAPNPSHGATQLFYDFNAPITTDTTLVIYDLLGRLLATHQPNTSNGIWELDMSAYAKGQYIAVMKQNGKAVEQKNIIVQ
jgi:PKD repeat protein